ncbi:hypothetical protein LKR43_14490 [Pusillimonas sp. MFBS29]|uniref:hypothetical protein n=1 Tax=Pusillimonas sp. MFBS29 TaxID=2886690 RepID=UPI001D11781B|nr:hypothetical protein [Pusillimonas sp. MFBS29]MCC2597543.1 hypothetical protein [Pusillimonas sp. MFBS29]
MDKVLNEIYAINYSSEGVRFSSGIRIIFIVPIFVALNLMLFIEAGLLYYLNSAVVVFATIGSLYLYRIHYQELISIVLLVGSLFLFGVLCVYFGGNVPAYSLYIPIISSGLLGYLSLKYDKDNIILKSLYYIIFVYAFFIMLMLLLGRDPDTIWRGSRNLGSQVFVVVGALFVIYLPIKISLKFWRLFFFMIFFICVLLMGRSGIIASFLLLMAALLRNFTMRLNLRTGMMLAFLLVLTSLLLFYFDVLLSYLNSYSNLDYLRAKGLEDSYRSAMIAEFFQNYSLKVFLFGIDLSKLPYISSFNNNPHNGFIALHARLGVLALVPYMLLALLGIKLFSRKHYAAVLALVAMLIRFGTDSVAGIVLFPVIFLALYFCVFDKLKKE